MKALMPESQGTSPLRSETQALEKTFLGNYRVLTKLGSGGMANVYLGQRAGAHGASELVAIKVMLPQLAQDPHSLSMFFDEARTTSAIRHPAVCRVLDFGTDAGTPYLVTEYVLGETLGDLIDELHRTPSGRAIAGVVSACVVAQVCEGLDAAHEACDAQGTPLHIVHRDIAPQNIMVGYDGRVRVLDFGIARAADQQHVTQHGVLRGRFPYMSPEQIESGPLDRRADIWSSGVILWEGATGRRLFKRDTISETMRAVIADPLAPMLRATGDLHHGLLDVIERAVVRDATRRYTTARKMGQDLSALTNIGPTQMQPLMRRLFAARLEAKMRLLAEIGQERRTIMFDGTSYRSVRPEPGSVSGLRASVPSLPGPITSARTSSGVTLEAGSHEPAQGSDAVSSQPSTPLPDPTPAAFAGLRKKMGAMARPRPLLAAFVAISVLLVLLALETRGTEQALPRTSSGALRNPGVSKQSPSRAASRTGVSAPKPRVVIDKTLGEVVVSASELGRSAAVRVDGVAVGGTPARLALTAGPHVVEVWSGPPELPVLMSVDVVAGQTHTLSAPADPSQRGL